MFGLLPPGQVGGPVHDYDFGIDADSGPHGLGNDNLIVLAAQFESFVHPLIIMVTVPLALAGGLLITWTKLLNRNSGDSIPISI